MLPGSTPNTSLTVASVFDTAQGRQCAPGLYCVPDMNPSFGFISFDHILYAWLTIFQIISMVGPTCGLGWAGLGWAGLGYWAGRQGYWAAVVLAALGAAQ